MRGRKEAIVISNDTRNKEDGGSDKTTSKKCNFICLGNETWKCEKISDPKLDSEVFKIWIWNVGENWLAFEIG